MTTFHRYFFGAFAIAVMLTSSIHAEEPRWAIALHGGAGTIDRTMHPDHIKAYEADLQRALEAGIKVLEAGGTALDATQQVVMVLEDSPRFNAGRGAVFDRVGGHSLDASIMDGSTLACGGVASVTNIRNPIVAARLVMEKSPHVLMVSTGAEAFAKDNGAVIVAPNYFSTPGRFEQLQKGLKKKGIEAPDAPLHGWPAEDKVSTRDLGSHDVKGTVGCVALDTQGHLAAATSTGGMSGKLPGRVGDSPLIGAGNYANGQVAVSGTGEGEEYIRYSIATRVALLVELGGMTADQAVEHCLTKVLRPDDGGIIAIDHAGAITIRTSTVAMPHGKADSTGLKKVGVWLE